MWIYVPNLAASTSSPSAPVEAASTSESSWQSQALELSCTSRGKPMPAADWSRLWKRAGWLRRLSGQMPSPSLAEAGVASWMASLAASRASRQERWFSPATATGQSSNCALEIRCSPTEDGGEQSLPSWLEAALSTGKFALRAAPGSSPQTSIPSSLWIDAGPGQPRLGGSMRETLVGITASLRFSPEFGDATIPLSFCGSWDDFSQTDGSRIDTRPEPAIPFNRSRDVSSSAVRGGRETNSPPAAPPAQLSLFG